MSPVVVDLSELRPGETVRCVGSLVVVRADDGLEGSGSSLRAAQAALDLVTAAYASTRSEAQ